MVNISNLVLGTVSQERVGYVRNYLENYEKTYSTELDTKLGLFKSDVYGLSKAYMAGEVEVVTMKDYVISQLELVEPDDLRGLAVMLDDLSRLINGQSHKSAVIHNFMAQELYFY